MSGRGGLLAAAAAGAAAALLVSHVAHRRHPAPPDELDAPRDAATQLTASLWDTIPLSHTMGVRCDAFPAHDTAPLLLRAPLAANRNVHGTAFAGAIYAAAVLAGWAWAEAAASRRGGALARATVVVKAASIRYRAPLVDAFVCVALPPGAAALRSFADDFARTGKATLRLRVAVWTRADAAAGAALAADDAARAQGGEADARDADAPPPQIVTPDGRKPACVLDGEFTAVTPP